MTAHLSPHEPCGVAILGATGSIGANTLDVIARHPDRFRVVALTGHQRVEQLLALTMAHRPECVAVVDDDKAAWLRTALHQADPALAARVVVVSGEAGLIQAATWPTARYVMAAIVGAAGLAPTLAALATAQRLLLANKESLVMAGPLFMAEAARHGCELLPVDSEHNALFQCLYGEDGQPKAGLLELILTASGGPFRTWSAVAMAAATPTQAVKHPTWAMGQKISVDSATLMNKGLEVIEAHYLFQVPAAQIRVVIHPQSVIHSLVRFVDGSVLAQLGQPDMRTPIAHALAWPTRLDAGVAPLDLAGLTLTFEAPDGARFPALALAYAALQAGGTAPAILNAANEIAVAAFLAQQLSFDRITAVVEHTLASLPPTSGTTLAAILAADHQARAIATAAVAR